MNRTNGVAQNKTDAYGDALMDVIRNTIVIRLDTILWSRHLKIAKYY